jgi:hypothetical protein
MWKEPAREVLRRIPGLYQTEEIPLRDKPIYLHFFIGGCDWYVAEYDGHDLFFGYAILNSDTELGEWGYISFEELRRIRIPPGFEVDCEVFIEPVKASGIEKIRVF